MEETDFDTRTNPQPDKFERNIPLVKPFTPSMQQIGHSLMDILDSGMLTNSKHVQTFEGLLADYFEVNHAVAVSSCTIGIIMTLKVLDLRGEILVPSFTFSATGHACFWAGLDPVFVDCNERDWTISLFDCQKGLSRKTSALMAVHTFGNPADIDALEEFAEEHNLNLIFDSAHAFGSRYKGIHVGNGGQAEIFSLTPTKIVTSGEGGVITTNDNLLAKELQIFRNYGDDGSYDCKCAGLNGRMAEFNAILGTATLEHAAEEIRARNEIANIYHENLNSIPGIAFQEIYPHNISSYKDFTILIDEKAFGTTRDEVANLLARRGIPTRKYFYPPLHMQTAYKNRTYRNTALTQTKYICKRTLTLPMHSFLTNDDVKWICESIRVIHGENITFVENNAANEEKRPSLISQEEATLRRIYD